MTVHERRADRAAFLALCGLGGSRALGFITATYTLLLVFATHYPKPEHFLGTHAFYDKVLHFAAYFLLASLAAATLAECRRWGPRRAGTGVELGSLCGYRRNNSATFWTQGGRTRLGL